MGDLRSFDLSMIFLMKDGDLLFDSELEAVFTCKLVGDDFVVVSVFLERDAIVEAMEDCLLAP